MIRISGILDKIISTIQRNNGNLGLLNHCDVVAQAAANHDATRSLTDAIDLTEGAVDDRGLLHELLAVAIQKEWALTKALEEEYCEFPVALPAVAAPEAMEGEVERGIVHEKWMNCFERALSVVNVLVETVLPYCYDETRRVGVRSHEFG